MEKNKLRILMVGGRRCGKSTTLAAMWKNSSSALNNTGLTLVPKNVAVLNDFSNKIDDIIFNYFDDFEPFRPVKIDTVGSSGDTKYEFDLSLSGSGERLTLEFVDVPGEWYDSDHGTSNPEEAAKRARLLNEYILTSDVYIIAIDTPCLMENMGTCGFGEYHYDANKPLEIAEYLKENIEISNFKSKNFIFVPLKCEKYNNLNRMGRVVDCIKNGYAELLSFLAGPNLKNSCSVSVMPIISIGGFEFSEFTGPLEAPDISANYRYCNGIDSKYSPQYCEQPLISAIEFLISRSIEHQSNGPRSWWERLIDKLIRILFKSTSGAEFEFSPEFTAAIKKLHSKRVEDSGKGFVTLQKGSAGV